MEHRDPRDAVSIYESILTWVSSTRLYDVRLVRVYNMAAQVYDKSGRTNEAIEYYERALEMGSRFLPDDHVECLVARNNLAARFYAKQSYEMAISHCEALLDILSASLEGHTELRFSMRGAACISVL